MTRIKKNEMITLIKGFEHINTIVETGQHVNVDILTQCQEQVINLGNYIEIRYKDIDIVPLIHTLEEYCECVYLLSQQKKNKDRREIVKQIRNLINIMQNEIVVKLPDDKKQVVFLPYKASMWDSLESIYLSVSEDASCDAYVIPIPYFDKNPDGTLNQLFYEGDQFPKGIPITSWQEYSMEENRPDVVYVHNPYDNWNHVTSIHPNYYSRELKKYIDELIYVPYFVLREIEPDDQAAIDRMKSFITMPGVIYADKVIVQSEKMKQIYVNEYLKFAKKNGLHGHHIDRKYQEQRILGLGSPKFDKVLKTKKEELEIPDKWLKIIQKTDGNWKKIIFYNTSIIALLRYGDEMLEKMEEVFRIFYENRDVIALLWRPHPLIPSTIKSMHPELWAKYSWIVDKYRMDEWGIYDDTADVNRAVMLSDAYYGDSSSVVQIYEKTKKPIMIQNADLN